LSNEVLVKVGTQIRFFVTGSFSPADAGTNSSVGTPTDVVLTLSGVANGAARQSTKFDFGATRAARYSLIGCVDYTGETPSATGQVDYYLAPSAVSTQGNGNVAGNSGADAACPDGALGSITLAEFLKQCLYIGSLYTHDGAVVQNGFVGVFSPPERYGQLIVVNNGGDAFEADDVEMHQVMNPIVDEIQ
jgi:hypothetical protein